MKNANSNFFVGFATFEGFLQAIDGTFPRVFFLTRTRYSTFEKHLEILVSTIQDGVCFYWLMRAGDVNTLADPETVKTEYEKLRKRALAATDLLKEYAKAKGFRTADAAVTFPFSDELELIYGGSEILKLENGQPVIQEGVKNVETAIS